MLQSIHDKAKGILGIIIVIFIGLVFALWGIGDYLTGAPEKFAAKVDDLQISQSQFDQALAQQRQRLQQQFQAELPEGEAFEQRLKQQVLEQLITQRVLQKMVAEQGYRVPDQVLAQQIKAMEAFQQDGAFSNDAYQAIIGSQGMSVKEFENLFRSDLAIQQLQDAVMQSSIVGKAELEILNRIQNQSRKVNYLLFADDHYMDQVEVTDEEIRDYFSANQQAYMNPETVRVAYVEITQDDLLKDIPLDEDALQRLYDDYVASQSGKEQRRARHILFELPADASTQQQQAVESEAAAVMQQLQQGASFEQLASEHSSDPGSANQGGDLGWISRGMMLPEFEQALYALGKGEVSEPVKTSFGYHIIRVDDVRSEKIDSFADKKAELTEMLQARALEDQFYERSELMATTAYENDRSLQAVADALGAKIKTSEQFSRDTGEGIAENEAVRKAAFDTVVLDEGRNSDIIEVAPYHAVVLRIETHTEATAKQLDEVKARIAMRLRLQKAAEKAREAAQAALTELESGTSITALQTSAELVELESLQRSSRSVDMGLLREVFSMPKPVNGQPVNSVTQVANGTALIQLVSVSEPPAMTDEQLQQLAQQYQNEQASRDMSAVLDHLKSKVDIVRAERL
ncbi:MAG TPA: SurA N-terminal domain-containing protein [Gammaproteobacteria bacterium]